MEKRKVLEAFMEGYGVVSMCTKVCKRSCLLNPEKVDFAKIKHGDDSLQSLAVFDRAKSYCYINKTLYNYRMDSGMTSKYDPSFYRQFKCVLLEILDRKEIWGLKDFDTLFIEKLMNILGRSITQSRFGTWKSIEEQADYLRDVYDDDLVREYVAKYHSVKSRLQLSYRMILPL